MEIKNTETVIIKRTHKKPYKVGKLYFGRRSTERGAGWIVSASSDLSNPVAEFEIGKLARAYCEEQRELAKNPAEIPVNIPSDTPFGNIFGGSGSEII